LKFEVEEVKGMQARDAQVLTTANMTEYFRHSLSAAMANQHLSAAEDTVSYVVRLLASFARTENLFERTPDGLMQRPLALFYADAVDATSVEERNMALRRLGDVALFISGIFADSLNRKVVDVDYYIAMGGNAYGHLADGVSLTEVFSELAGKFAAFVEVLGEVSDRTSLKSNADIMRIYEIWIRTGSERAARKLRKLGVEPAVFGSGAGLFH